MPSKAAHQTVMDLKEAVAAARGTSPAEVVIRGAQYLDVFGGCFRRGDVAINKGMIVGISESYEAAAEIDGRGLYVVPGFIDAHVHIESSLMTPARFEQAVLPCGTTTVIWDPHEIANVRGVEGIQWALAASEGLSLDVFVMIPSCVPSTSPAAGLETSGATLVAADLAPFRDHPRVLGLAEMMNFPGLLAGEGDVLQKLVDFKSLRRDGHCPGLSGKDLNAYGVAGIHSCHESTTLHEAQEKLTKGIHVLIREGSCAKDADALLPLLTPYSSAVVSLCSDDRNPADIAETGHISCIVEKALRAGHPPEVAFRAASFAPARLFGLEDRGAVAPGYAADLVLVKPRGAEWRSGFFVEEVLKGGKRLAEQNLGRPSKTLPPKNQKDQNDGAVQRNLHLQPVNAATFVVAVPKEKMDAREISVRVIGTVPRQILTHAKTAFLSVIRGQVQASLAQDVLKIAVLERHHGTGQHATGFVRGFQIKTGAVATSINHDSHNVITVGASDELMALAVNKLIEIDGGIVVVSADGTSECLPLPIGGLMSDQDPAVVTQSLHRLKAMALKIGCQLEEPFLQLSFLALPVIPSLKITDKGLVDVTRFERVSVFLD